MRPYKVFDGYVDLDRIVYINDIDSYKLNGKNKYVVWCHIHGYSNEQKCVIESTDEKEAKELYDDLIKAWKNISIEEPKTEIVSICLKYLPQRKKYKVIDATRCYNINELSIDKLRSIVGEFNMDVIESDQWYIVERK